MKRFPCDYHIHSSFSFDSQAPCEDFVLAAINEGMGEICFTEHKDLDPFYNETGFYKDEPYENGIKRLQGKYSGQIGIRKGVELDFQSKTAVDFEEFVRTHDFDFVIGGVHALEHQFVDSYYFRGKDPDKVYRDYLLEVLSLSTLKSFDVLGHLDYVTRFSPAGAPLDPVKYDDIIGEILRNIIRNGKGIELNTSGWRHGIGKPFPGIAILKKYKKLGGSIITMGSDSHRPQDVGSDFDRGARLLREIGLDGIYVFENHRPARIPLPAQ